MFTWHAHETAVTALAFGPDGRFLVSGGADECVRVWDPLTGAERCCISLQYPDRSLHQSLLPPPLRWITLADDQHAIVYQFSRRQHFLDQRLAFLDLVRQCAAAERSTVNVLALKRIPNELAAIALTVGVPPDRSAKVRLCDFATQTETVMSLSSVSTSSRALAFSPDGSFLAVGTRVFPWPLTENARGYRVWMKDYEPDDLAFSADNQYLFALVGGKIVVYGLPDGLFKTKLKGHNGGITAMALTPNGTRLWTASRDATVKCWDTRSLTLDRTYTFQTGGLDCLAVSPCGNVAAAGSGQKGTITLWDLG